MSQARAPQQEVTTIESAVVDVEKGLVAGIPRLSIRHATSGRSDREPANDDVLTSPGKAVFDCGDRIAVYWHDRRPTQLMVKRSPSRFRLEFPWCCPRKPTVRYTLLG